MGKTGSDDDVPRGPTPRRDPAKGFELMVLWPAVTLVGFLVLTALVIAMGVSSTARYEREQRAANARPAARAATAEPVGARAA